MRSSLIILVWWSLFRNVLVVDHCQDRGLLRPAQLEQPSFSTSSLRRAASLLELMLMLLSGVKDRPRPSLRRNTSPRVMSTSSRWWEKNNLYQILLSILSILQDLTCKRGPEFVIFKGRMVLDQGIFRPMTGFGEYLPLPPFSPHVYDKIAEKRSTALARARVERTEEDMTVIGK